MAARDKWYGRKGKEGDGGKGGEWLVMWGCGWCAQDSNFEVIEVSDNGVAAEVDGNPVDGNECRRDG